MAGMLPPSLSSFAHLRGDQTKSRFHAVSLKTERYGIPAQRRFQSARVPVYARPPAHRLPLPRKDVTEVMDFRMYSSGNLKIRKIMFARRSKNHTSGVQTYRQKRRIGVDDTQSHRFCAIIPMRFGMDPTAVNMPVTNEEERIKLKLLIVSPTYSGIISGSWRKCQITYSKSPIIATV